MARSKTDVAKQQQRLKLKQEELTLRLKKQETADKLNSIRNQLRAVGGRIR
jgi:hypothetical protein